MNRSCVGLVVLVASFSVFASDFWTNEFEFGSVITTGNTEERNFKFRGDATRDSNSTRFKQTFNLDVLQSSKDSEKTAQKYYGSYQLDYKLGGEHSLFGRIAYEDDRFSGFDYQTDSTLGYNRLLMKSEVLELNGAIGAGLRVSEFETGGSESEFIVRFAGDLVWQFSTTATFRQMLSTEIGAESTISRSETSLSTNIVGNLAMKLALTVKHQSDVPRERSQTDTETSVTVVYKFQ